MEEKSPKPASQTAPKPVAAGLKILLAEDNKINQKFAIAILGKAGHSVTLAENGHQAVDALRATDFDLVLMDIQMPELDGVGATREIRKLPAPKNAIPIIAMTAHAMAGAPEAEYLAAGMDDYIAKPVEPEALFATLAKFAAGKGKPKLDSVDAKAPDRLPVLNRAKTEMLVESLSLETMRDFFDIFLADTLSHIAAMETGDLAAAARDAHVVVSAAGNIGAERLSAQARLMETACRDGHAKQANRLLTELRATAAATESEIRIWLRTHETPEKARA